MIALAVQNTEANEKPTEANSLTDELDDALFVTPGVQVVTQLDWHF